MLYSMTTAATAVAGYDMCVPVTMPPPYPVSPHHPVTETSRGSGLCRTTSNGYRSDQAPSPASPASSTTSSSSALSSRSEPPKRLRHWLIDMINSGTIPGLQWENAERTVFRIPWKHAGKNNWREEDCRIFKVSPDVIELPVAAALSSARSAKALLRHAYDITSANQFRRRFRLLGRYVDVAIHCMVIGGMVCCEGCQTSLSAMDFPSICYQNYFCPWFLKNSLLPLSIFPASFKVLG